MDDMLTLMLSREEAESILRAHDVATGETSTGAVSGRICEAIAVKWPDLRGQYLSPPEGYFYQRTERIADLYTHDIVCGYETWMSNVPTRTYFAAPECAGVELDQPFVTAIFSAGEISILLPRKTPHNLKVDCIQAAKIVTVKGPAAVEYSRLAALKRWKELIDEGRVWWECGEWHGSSLCGPNQPPLTVGEKIARGLM